MTDLAPFVAAALRDRVVQELTDENKKLKDEKFIVNITSDHGKFIDNEVDIREDQSLYSIDDYGKVLIYLPINEDASGNEIDVPYEALEIRVGGDVLVRGRVLRLEDLELHTLGDNVYFGFDFRQEGRPGGFLLQRRLQSSWLESLQWEIST
jgi:hypothetical protein